ncbi:unnamed protein product [Caretta caretta]
MALRRSQVLSYLREGRYSVVFLQETHTDPAAEDRWRLEWGDGVYFSHFATWQAGVATLFSPNLRPEVLGVNEAVPGHVLHLRVRMEGLMVNLVNIYAPQMSSRRPQFYQQVSDFLGTLDSHESLVLGGDFNTTLEERDRSGAEPSLAAANILQGIVDHHSLVDVWRDHHPDDTSTFTFVRVEAHRSHHSRLDRIYLSRFHLSQAHSSAVRPAPFSDHHLATVTVSLRAERPGPAYWHFNNSLLEDESFVMSFREFWLAWREQWHAFPSVRRWWDLGKVRAKLFCRDYTRGTSRRRNAAIEQLEREVLEMERCLATDPEDPSLCGACREKREELRALEDHRARGAFVRSRIRLLREMDRGSRFFYALEKTRGAKKHVTCLLAEDGTPLTDPEEMCGRARDFYTSLFSPDPTDPDACEVLWEELPTVSVGDRDRLELPLTLAEFSEALHRMPTNKSPGMDGLTVEFYRAFWDILGPDLVTVWAESLQSGVLPLSCRRAVLALLPKKGDLRDLRNWRPVSLLSTDYKIVVKAISLRLGSVMADVVHPDQTYTVPGRSIFDNLFLVRDLLELGRRDGLSFALLSLDQEKAFDRVDHGYLLSTLQAFGFGPQFVSFLRVLYASAECLVRLNWTLTEPVSFGRGVRQGCPSLGPVVRSSDRAFPLSPPQEDDRGWCCGSRSCGWSCRRTPMTYSSWSRTRATWRSGGMPAIYSAASSVRVNWVQELWLGGGGLAAELERHLAASPEDPLLCGARREKREELRALEDHRVRGAFVQSRICLLREMDRGSRFFYALEKMRGAKKHVTCLLAEDGTPLTEPVEMCGRVRAFYSSLFSPDLTDPGACRVLWEELPTVSASDRDRLELPLTLAEFSEALRRVPTNKSPGMDGLTVEFYRVFWDVLGPDLVTVWAKSLQSRVLPLSCRRAVLALLPKKGDLRDLQNWRPVSLLSTDYKIVAKAISLQLGSVLADVIHPDQTYTVPDRSIFDNLFLVRDLLELGRRDGLLFALLSLDQEKAFDRVDHGYLLNTLRAFGFGPQRLTGLVLREPELRLVLSVYADDVLLVVQDSGDLARVEACQAIYSAASSA